jgi:capsular exopolysaccharide synthesis family protein
MQNNSEFEISWIIHILRRWMWLIIGCGLVFGIGALIMIRMIAPKYEATATLLIEPAKDSSTSDYTMIIAAERLALTYSQMVEAQPILEELAKRLHLTDVEKLKDQIETDPIQNTQLFRLTASDASPKQAALLANTTAEILTEYIKNLQAERYQATLKSLQERLDETSKKVDEAQVRIDSLSTTKTKAEADLSLQETLLTEYRSDLRTLEQNQRDLLLTVDQFKNEVDIVEPAYIPENIVRAPYYATVIFLLPNAGLAQTYSQMAVAQPVIQAAISQLGLSVTPEEMANKVNANPIPNTQLIQLSVRDSNRANAIQIADVMAKEFLSQVQGFITEPYNTEIAMIQEKIADVSTKIEQSQNKVNELTIEVAQADNELARYSTQLSEDRSDFRTLQQKYDDQRLVSVQAADAVVITEPAQAPEKPTQSSILYVGLATLVGLMVGGCVAIILEILDDTIKTAEDLNEKFGLNSIGMINDMKKSEFGVVVEDLPRSPNAEAFRVLATNIRFTSLDKPIHTLLVTSAHPLDGKTFVASNLAAAISQTEKKVVVVDADLRLPHLHQFMKVEQNQGLTGSLLTNTVEENLQVSRANRLSVLTSGEIPPNPTEVLASRSMRKILDKLTELVEFVVIDSPPVLLAADASTLATQVDGVLLVVRVGKTTNRAIQETLKNLRQVQANVVGVVLNGVPPSKNYYYYRYPHQSSKRKPFIGIPEIKKIIYRKPLETSKK